VEDNGIGMTKEQLDNILKQMGENANSETLPAVYGLYNVSKRLELYYNQKASIDIQSVYTEGTKVTLKIPEAWQNV
jgi:two-component system sensor histidine kinase YesM